MEEQNAAVADPVESEGVGARLRKAREAAGYDLERVAAETRIPQRHLASIEAGEFGKLPSRTYAVGFTRTYARMIGLDERAMVEDVRAELASGEGRSAVASAKFEPGDPARVPGRGLVWFAALAAIIFIAGIYAFYRSYYAPGMGPAPLTRETPAVASQHTARQRPAAASAAVPSGPVVFTAMQDGTWVRFYEADGERLFEAEMAKGQSFTVPATAREPRIWTGRPDALAITIGGRQVPRLSDRGIL